MNYQYQGHELMYDNEMQADNYYQQSDPMQYNNQ